MTGQAAVGSGSGQGKKYSHRLAMGIFFNEDIAQKIHRIIRRFSLDLSLLRKGTPKVAKSVMEGERCVER